MTKRNAKKLRSRIVPNEVWDETSGVRFKNNMRRIILPTLIFICSVSMCFAESSRQVKIIKVQVEQEFTITLEANATTGYQWQLAKPLDEAMFQLVSSEYIADKTNRVGSGGKQVWIFKALKPGEAGIYFKYVRPWEKDVPPVKKESFLITITGNEP